MEVIYTDINRINLGGAAETSTSLHNNFNYWVIDDEFIKQYKEHKRIIAIEKIKRMPFFC